MHKIGAHVSAAGGIDKAVERAAAIGADAVQVFSGSPRIWQRPGLDRLNKEAVFAKQKELGVDQIFTHAIYLTNLASDNLDLVNKSIDVLKYDLKFDSALKGSGVVVHLGSHQGRGWGMMRDQVASSISKILAGSPEDSHLLVENSAGQNGKVCSDLGEIRWLMDQVKSPRLGWCFDTCHGFAAGLSLGAQKVEDACMTVVEEIDKWHLWEELTVIHVNDSRDPFNSGRDRHANLGEGNIPSEELAYFLNFKEVKNKPLILEVPGVKDEGPDAENVNRLKQLVDQV